MPFLKKFGPKIHITTKRIESTQKLFKKYGNFLLIVGYFIPGVRHLTAYVAGISHMEFRKFMIFAYSGAFLWSITFISLGHKLGERWYMVGDYIHRYGYYIFGAIILVAFGLVAFLKFRQMREKAVEGTRIK